MTPAEEQKYLLGQLQVAEAALRNNLHRHGLDAVARAHLDRAHSHICEAHIAINEAGKARTVQRLVDDAENLRKLLERARQPSSAQRV